MTIFLFPARFLIPAQSFGALATKLLSFVAALVFEMALVNPIGGGLNSAAILRTNAELPLK